MGSQLSNIKFQLTSTCTATQAAATTFTVTNDTIEDKVITATNASVLISSLNGKVIARFVGTFAAGTFTITSRWLTSADSETEDTDLQKERRVWSIGKIVAFAFDNLDVSNDWTWPEIKWDIIFSWDNTFSGIDTFTKGLNVPVFADSTARDATITSPANGMECYLTDTWEFNDYTAWSWESRTSGSITPNASVTVAGKVEQATDAQVWANTETGETWAPLFINPDSVVKTSWSVYTPAYLTGGSSATAWWATWTWVTDWEFTITIDWTARDITGLDFSSTTDEDWIAAVIQTWIRDTTTSTETCVWSTDHFIITSTNTTSSSAVTVTSAVWGWTWTDISWVWATEYMDSESWVWTTTSAVSDTTQDENKLPVLDATGKLASWFMDTYVEATVDAAKKFGWDGTDWAVDWTADITLTGTNSTLITKNYTSWTAGTAARTFSVGTLTGCVFIIKIQWDCDLTNWTIDWIGGIGAYDAWAAPSGESASWMQYVVATAWATGASSGYAWGWWAGFTADGSTASTWAAGWVKPARQQLIDIIPSRKYLWCAWATGWSSETVNTHSVTGWGWWAMIIFEVWGNLTVDSGTTDIDVSGWAGWVATVWENTGWGGWGGWVFVMLYNGTLTGTTTPTVLGWLGWAGSVNQWWAGWVWDYLIEKNTVFA